MPYYEEKLQADANGNISGNNFIPSYATTPTAASTTVLTVASAEIQRFTGATTQTVTLPPVSTLPKTGFGFWIVNDSSGNLTVNSSGANLVATVLPGNRLWVFCILLTGTTAASWDTMAVVTVTPGSGNVGYLNIPPNPQSADYTTVLADSGKCVLHPVTDDNPRTFTINKNATVPYPLGACIQFINRINTLTIAIDTDTLIWSEDGSTGPRTLSANGTCVAEKTEATVWILNGSGLS